MRLSVPSKIALVTLGLSTAGVLAAPKGLSPRKYLAVSPAGLNSSGLFFACKIQLLICGFSLWQMKGIDSQSINRVKQAEFLAAEAVGNDAIVSHKVVSDAATNTSSTSLEDPTVVAPYANIWASLTSAEAASVVAFLHNQTELNLTASADAGSYVFGLGYLSSQDCLPVV